MQELEVEAADGSSNRSNQVLSGLRIGLKETYSLYFRRMVLRGTPYSHAILQWLLFSLRPLNLPEIVEATNTSICGRSLTKEDVEKQRQLVVEWCGPFVTVTTPADGNLVLLSHYSVKEFLLNKTGDLDMPHFPIRDGHEVLLRQCLNTIIRHAPRVSKQNPRPAHLLSYASEFWPSHLDSFRSSDPEQPLPTDIMSLLSKLFDSKSPEVFVG